MDDQAKALYRRALGAFPTGVAVITAADGEGHPVALTVNSYASISLDPPLVMWSLGSATERGVWFLRAEHFAVNILGAEDAALAAAHARRGAYRLQLERLAQGLGEAPSISGVLARLACRVHQRIALGDHTVIVGEVTGFDSRDGDALTYFRGRYGRAAAHGEAI